MLKGTRLLHLLFFIFIFFFVAFTLFIYLIIWRQQQRKITMKTMREMETGRQYLRCCRLWFIIWAQSKAGPGTRTHHGRSLPLCITHTHTHTHAVNEIENICILDLLYLILLIYFFIDWHTSLIVFRFRSLNFCVSGELSHSRVCIFLFQSNNNIDNNINNNSTTCANIWKANLHKIVLIICLPAKYIFQRTMKLFFYMNKIH